MEIAVISSISELLANTAPWGFVALLAWGFWRINERKDKQLVDMHQRLITLAEAQISATVKMESALVSLRTAIEGLMRK